jgi:hypothetical protein
MKKVLGFDSWTGGAIHYQHLLTAFNARSMQLSLAHIGSWGNEPLCPPTSQFDNLLMRDITFYKGNSLEEILDIERPDAVILTSTDTFAHRAFIRYCKQRSIPTLNLYHGLLGATDTDAESAAAIALFSHIRYVLSKLGKLFKHTFPCYIKSLLKTKANRKDWGRFISDIFLMAAGVKPWNRMAAADSKTTKCAVYIKADVDHAMRFHGFSKEDVHEVGIMDLLKFGLSQEMIGSWTAPPECSLTPIMYIECGLPSQSMCYADTQGFVNHLLMTSDALIAQGYRMRLKLKPNQYYSKSIEEKLTGSQIELVTNENFLETLMECAACIVETSTLAMLPALLGMPLLLAKYGDLTSLRFGSLLTGCPRSYPLKDVSDISDILLKDAKTSDRTKLNSWIDLNVGPLPPEKMPERVAAIVEKMITTASRQKSL